MCGRVEAADQADKVNLIPHYSSLSDGRRTSLREERRAALTQDVREMF